ncbi:hypothetical protein PCE1_001967 [Barthelona sp. PCE]
MRDILSLSIAHDEVAEVLKDEPTLYVESPSSIVSKHSMHIHNITSQLVNDATQTMYIIANEPTVGYYHVNDNIETAIHRVSKVKGDLTHTDRMLIDMNNVCTKGNELFKKLPSFGSTLTTLTKALATSKEIVDKRLKKLEEEEKAAFEEKEREKERVIAAAQIVEIESEEEKPEIVNETSDDETLEEIGSEEELALPSKETTPVLSVFEMSSREVTPVQELENDKKEEQAAVVDLFTKSITRSASGKRSRAMMLRPKAL